MFSLSLFFSFTLYIYLYRLFLSVPILTGDRINVRTEQLPYQLLDLVESIAQQDKPPFAPNGLGVVETHCEYFDHREREEYLKIIKVELDLLTTFDSPRSIPMKKVSLEDYKQYSIWVDARIRGTYEYKSLLYENKSAVDEARSLLSHQRLDLFKIFSDEEFWKDWISDLFVKKLRIQSTCRPKT